LATKLGKVLCQMVEGPLSSVEIGVFGEASKFDSHPIASASMVGLLCRHHAVPVNQINALHLARRQGINVTKVSSADSKDYLSLVRITAQSSEQTVILEGAIFDESRPRLVKINGYEIESPLEGHLLITKHADEPGVVGKIGEALGKEDINISRMQVGVAEDTQLAIAILDISGSLSSAALENISKIGAVEKVLQVLL